MSTGTSKMCSKSEYEWGRWQCKCCGDIRLTYGAKFTSCMKCFNVNINVGLTPHVLIEEATSAAATSAAATSAAASTAFQRDMDMQRKCQSLSLSDDEALQIAMANSEVENHPYWKAEEINAAILLSLEAKVDHKWRTDSNSPVQRNNGVMWSCIACTFENPSGNSNCGICKTEAPRAHLETKAEPVRPVIHPPAIATGWICDACTFKNKLANLHCDICTAARFPTTDNKSR